MYRRFNKWNLELWA